MYTVLFISLLLNAHGPVLSFMNPLNDTWHSLGSTASSIKYDTCLTLKKALPKLGLIVNVKKVKIF